MICLDDKTGYYTLKTIIKFCCKINIFCMSSLVQSSDLNPIEII